MLLAPAIKPHCARFSQPATKGLLIAVFRQHLCWWDWPEWCRYTPYHPAVWPYTCILAPGFWRCHSSADSTSSSHRTIAALRPGPEQKKAQAMSHRPNSPVAQVKRANRSRQHLSPMTWTPRVCYCWLLRTGSSSTHASRSRWSLWWLRARADRSRKPVCWPFTAWYLSKGAGPGKLIDNPSSQWLSSLNKDAFEMDNERLGWCCVFGGHCCPITCWTNVVVVRL